MEVQNRISKTEENSPSGEVSSKPQKLATLIRETSDYTLPKVPRTRALKRKIVMPEEIERTIKPQALTQCRSISNLASARERLNTELLVPLPIRVLCDLKQNQTIQEQQQRRHMRLMTLEKELDIEREGICFSKQSNSSRLLEYKNLAKVVSYDLQPEGLCSAKNCSVRRQWVKLLRNEIESNLLRLDEHTSTKTSLSSFDQLASITQIRHDAIRTFTTDQKSQPIPAEHLNYLQKTLEELLVEYSRMDSEVDYVQGMNLVAGAILNHLREINLSLRMFKFVMDKHNLRDLYLRQFGLLKEHCEELFHRHLKGVAPDIYDHLTKQNVSLLTTQIQPIMFLPPWLLSLFCCIVPNNYTHLVIDLYVVSGFAGLYRLAICYMIFLRERILAEKEEALMILGTSYSRKLPICWPQLITASQRVPLC